MFKKENRLSTNFEFNITRKYGKKIRGDYFFMYYLKAKNYEGPVKVGIVVSNKVDKVAANRNRIKRLYRESLKEHIPNLPNNLWMVIHPKAESLKTDYEKISTDVNQVLSQISLA